MEKVRCTSWTFIFYECPDWKGIIEDWCVKCMVSPLHDQDVYTERDVKKAKEKGREVDFKAGDPKKPHYHGIIIFESLKSKKQVVDLVQELGGYMEVKAVNAMHAMTRYLCHLDNPQKYQYDPAEITAFAGVNVANYLTADADEFADVFKAILKYVYETNQSSLINFLMRSCEESVDWYYFCMNPKGFNMVKSIIDSQNRKRKEFREAQRVFEAPEWDWEYFNETLELREIPLEDEEEAEKPEDEKKEKGEKNDGNDNEDGREVSAYGEGGNDKSGGSVCDGPDQDHGTEAVLVCADGSGADFERTGWTVVLSCDGIHKQEDEGRVYDLISDNRCPA